MILVLALLGIAGLAALVLGTIGALLNAITGSDFDAPYAMVLWGMFTTVAVLLIGALVIVC